MLLVMDSHNRNDAVAFTSESHNCYYSKSHPGFGFFARAAQITRNAMEMTSGDPAPRAPRPLRRRLVGTTLGAGPARPDADASDERIVELWLRDRPANTRVAYERDYAASGPSSGRAACARSA
jgi:hypothetical protein